MLIGSGVRLSTSNPMFQLGAALAGSAERAAWAGAGKLRNLQAGYAGVSNKSGYPDGVRHPVSWSMPNKAGALASRNETVITLTPADLNLAAGRNIEGSTTVTITAADAELQLIVSATGSATITFTQTGLLSGALYGQGTGAIAITVPAAELGAIVSAMGSGTLTLDGAGTATAIGHLEGHILPYTELSPEALATAVWSALAVDNNDAGTMGEKLNDAGSASNPWTEVIESGYTAAEILRILTAVAAGKTVITDLGGGAATVEFRDIDDTKTRVEADMTDSERTSVTLDGSA